jgi:hypothetical protein
MVQVEPEGVGMVPNGFRIAKGAVEWPEQMLLLGCTSDEARNYPLGEGRYIDLKGFHRWLSDECGAHMDKIWVW